MSSITASSFVRKVDDQSVELQTDQRTGYLPTLDGWRAIAILAVLVCHGVSTLFCPSGPWPDAKLFAYAFHGGYGVPVFFAISGFLITCRLVEEASRPDGLSLRRFYIRRCFRILPASWCFLVTLFMLQQWHLIHMELSAWLAALLFAKNFVDDKTNFLSHFWSLSVEEQFYFFWPACFGFLSSTGQGWKLITTCSLSLFMLIAANLNKGFNGLASMGFGCTLALLFADPQLRKALTSVMSTRNWYLCVAIVLLGVFSKLPFTHWWLPPLMGLMVVGTVVRPMTLAGRILELKWLRWVGRCSYSIYLWQELFCVMGMPTHPFGILQTFPLNILCSFACAIPSFYFIEKPLIHLGHRFAPPATPGRSDLSK